MANTPLDPIDDKTLHDLVKRNTRSDDAQSDQLIALYKKDFPQQSNIRIYQIIASDNWLTAKPALVAQRKAGLGKAPAYLYHFERLSPARGGKLGVPHTSEINYVFDNLNIPTSLLLTGTDPAAQALADKMSAAWTAFARTGNPDAAGLPHWPPYSASNREVMIFDDTCKVVRDPHAAEREAINAVHKGNGMPAPS